MCNIPAIEPVGAGLRPFATWEIGPAQRSQRVSSGSGVQRVVLRDVVQLYSEESTLRMSILELLPQDGMRLYDIRQDRRIQAAMAYREIQRWLES